MKVRKMPVNDYPDTSYKNLRKDLSEYCHVRRDQLVVTNGADEALDIVTKALLDPMDEVIIPTPSYSMFRVSSEIMGASAVPIPRNQEFGLNIDLIRERCTERTKIIFLCSPNNPTGNSATAEEVESLLEISPDCTVVMDEAYYEFSGKTFSELVKSYDNLLVIRTFSKAFSMAGVRVGYIISSADSAKKLNLVRPPNSLGMISIFMAREALKDSKSMRRNVETISKEREKMSKEMLLEDNLKVYPSESNFVLFSPKDGKSANLHAALMKKGFVLRNLSGVAGVETCLRATVSTPEVNDLFLKTLSHELNSLR